MDLFEWLSTSLKRYRKPPPGFRFECLSDGRWLCLLCDRSVKDTQLGFHARARHGWQAPAVKIHPHRSGEQKGEATT